MKFLHSFIAIALAGTILSSCQGNCPSESYPQVFAHRGCWFEDFIPENSLDGVEMAARYGYPTTECDVKLTSDGVHVLMHDSSINRTMRNAVDYSAIEEPVYVSRCSFEELRSGYVLASADESRRAQIPTFKEYLAKCAECGILPILHCGLMSGYQEAQEVAGSNWIAFTTDYELLLKVRAMNPDVLILYAIDSMPGEHTPENVIARLDSIGGRVGISSMNPADISAEMIRALAAKGYETQSSIFPTPKEMRVIHDKASIILSDFTWFQTKGRKPSSTYVYKVKSMSEGETASRSWDKLEYGAMVISLSGEGEFELLVNGTRKYTVSHETLDTELLGFRLHDAVPSVELKSLKDGSSLKKLDVKIFEL